MFKSDLLIVLFLNSRSSFNSILSGYSFKIHADYKYLHPRNNEGPQAFTQKSDFTGIRLSGLTVQKQYKFFAAWLLEVTYTKLSYRKKISYLKQPQPLSTSLRT